MLTVEQMTQVVRQLADSQDFLSRRIKFVLSHAIHEATEVPALTRPMWGRIAEILGIPLGLPPAS